MARITATATVTAISDLERPARRSAWCRFFGLLLLAAAPAFSLDAQGPLVGPRESASEDAGRETGRTARTTERSRALGLSAGVGQSDNLERDPLNPLRSDIRFVGFDFDLANDSRRFQGTVRADMEVRSYSEVADDDDDREVIGSLDGALSVQIVPQRFSLEFAANSGQTRTNPLEAASPNNRERISILSFGPEFDIPLGGRTTLEVGLIGDKRNYEDTASLDGTAARVNVGLFRTTSPVSRIGLEYVGNEIDFKDASERGYRLRSVYFAYDKRFASGGFEVRLGRGELDAGGEPETQPVGRVRWDRDVGTRSRLAAWVSNEVTDSGLELQGGSRPSDLFGDRDDLMLEDINDYRLRRVALSADPMERAEVGIEFGVDGNRNTFSIAVNASRDSFDTTNDENKRGSVGVAYTRDLTRRWTAALVATVGRERLAAAATQEFRDETAQLSVSRLFGEGAALQLGTQRNRRIGDVESTDENVYVVSLRYAIAP